MYTKRKDFCFTVQVRSSCTQSSHFYRSRTAQAHKMHIVQFHNCSTYQHHIFWQFQVYKQLHHLPVLLVVTGVEYRPKLKTITEVKYTPICHSQSGLGYTKI